jgi:hypothetical protein
MGPARKPATSPATPIALSVFAAPDDELLGVLIVAVVVVVSVAVVGAGEGEGVGVGLIGRVLPSYDEKSRSMMSATVAAKALAADMPAGQVMGVGATLILGAVRIELT